MQALLTHPPSPLQIFNHPIIAQKNLRVWIKRDDLLQLEHHPGDQAFSGNKWRKLKYNLIRAKEDGYTRLLTFGGAFSNHITATASAGKLFGFETIGIIRGEAVYPLNPSLSFAKACGMHLHFVSREDYRQRTSPLYLAQLHEQFGAFYLLPEGGTNVLALEGCAELTQELEQQMEGQGPDYICVSCGTGGTLAGIIQGINGSTRAIGFSSLKGDFLNQEVEDLLNAGDTTNWEIQTAYHFGGYAKFSTALIDFINQIKTSYQIQLEPIYTAKLFYGVLDLIEQDYFSPGSSLVVIHTGGLQGIVGFNQRFGNLIKEV